MSMPGFWEWVIILAIVVLIFGTKKLRTLGGDLGAAIKNFKGSMRDGESQAAPPGDKPEPPQVDKKD